VHYYGNDDAGDLEIMGRADYEGEMAEQREHEQRLAYVERFDDVTGPMGVHVSFFEIPNTSGTLNGSGYLKRFKGRVVYRVHGPREAPHCDDCGERLERDNDEGRYAPRFALLYCSEECHDRTEYMPYQSEGREFPTYG